MSATGEAVRPDRARLAEPLRGESAAALARLADPKLAPLRTDGRTFRCGRCGRRCTRGTDGTEYGHQRVGNRAGLASRCPERPQLFG